MPGGVCAVLDYDVEMMAEYVAEMATRLALVNTTPSVSFRKFVSQILTSTRLPSTTILLGMNYLAKRINMMNMEAGQRVKFSEGQVWRMLTTSFLLGSKFLDDNTFQNRSWSEVSGIAVQELNTLENEWLQAINWSLYVNLDRSKDYNAWLKSWQDWQDNKKRQQQAQATRERRMPTVPQIDTDVRRLARPDSLWHRQQIAEYERLQSLYLKRTELSPQSSLTSGHDGWYGSRVAPWAAAPGPAVHPMTPPDSGYGTPEYINSATLNSATVHNAQYNEWLSRGLASGAYSHPNQYRQQPQPPHQPQQQQHSALHHSNSFNTGRQHTAMHHGHYQYVPSIWEPSPADCSCASCAGLVHPKHHPYSFSMTHHHHGYGQPVMG